MSVVATLLVRVAANLTELDKSFSDLERGADRISKAYGKLGSQLQGIGSKLTTSLTLPIAGIGAAATKSFADFDTAMKGVQAAITPTKAEMLALENAAMEWGAKTQFSATEAATALGELGKAGVNTADSIKLLPSVLNLATVGGMGLAEAASLTTDTLTQFKLSADKAGKVNDVLAKSAQVSTTSVQELGQALKYAGPVAGAFGMSIEETGAALALFANAGVKADMAGTALRGILTEVTAPAKGLRDVLEELNLKTLASADGTVHLTDILQKLERAGASSEQIMRAFGDRAGPAMVAAVSQGSGALRELNSEMEKSGGTAQTVAETLLSGLGGALEKMRGSVETAGIAIGKVLAPAIVFAADVIGSLAEFISGTLIPAFQAMPKAAQVAAGGIAGIAAAIGPAVYIAGTFMQSLSALTALFVQTSKGATLAADGSALVARGFTLQAAATWIATQATTAYAAVLGVLASPVTITIAAIGALVLGLRYLTGSWEGVLHVLSGGVLTFKTLERRMDDVKTIVGGLASGLGAMVGVVTDVASAVDGVLQTALGNTTSEANELNGALGPLNTTLATLGGNADAAANGGITNVTNKLAGLFALVSGPAAGAFTWLNRALEGAAAGVRRLGEYQDAATASQYQFYRMTQQTADELKVWNLGLTQAASVTDLAGIKLGEFGGTMGGVLSVAGQLTPKLAPVAAAITHTGTASKGAAEAAKKARLEFLAMIDAFTGQDVINKAFGLMNSLVQLRAKGFEPSAKAAKEIADAIEDAGAILKGQSKKIPDYMASIWKSLQPDKDTFDNLRDWFSFAQRAIVSSIPLITPPQLQSPIDKVLAGIKWTGFGAGLAAYLRGNELKAQIADWGREFGNQVNGIMAGMFTGQTGFLDGFKGMFAGVQDFAGEILGDFQKELFEGIKAGDLDIKAMFGGEKSLAEGAAAGAAVGMAVGVAFGRSFGKVTGMAMGAVSGALMGGMYGGWAGAAIGAGVGAVSGWFSGVAEEKRQKQAMQQARKEMQMTFGTMDEMHKAADRLGVSWEALWETKDLIRFQAALDHLNLGLADEKNRLEDLARGLDKTAESGALLSKELIKAMDTKLPGGTEAIGAFMDAQFKAATAGLDAFLTNTTVKTAQGAAAISASLAAMYEQMVAGGMAPTAAFAALEPAVAKLQTQLTESGLAGAEAFGPLAQLARLAADEIAGPMFDAMAGLEQGLTATFNMGLLNKEVFAGFAAELLAGYNALEAQGKGGVTAMAGMQGALQKVWELSEDFGYSLGEGERQLVDYAESAGLIGDRFRPAADRMANAIDALVERFDRFLERLETGLPAAATNAANAVQDAFRNLQMPTVEIPTRVLPPDNMPAGGYYHGGNSGSGFTVPAMASGGVVTRPTVALIGESGPEAVVPLSSAFAAETDLTVYLDSEVITRAVLRKQPRQLRVYGAAR